MKIIIEKCVCDVCDKEVNVNDRHYMINLGSSENWSDGVTIGEDNIKKDLCPECYKTIIRFIEMKSAVEEPVSKDKSHKRRNYLIDKELVKDLWARGLTYEQIGARTNAKRYQIGYIVNQMTREERIALRDKYSTCGNIQEEQNPFGMKITTDADGCVISVE